MRRIWAIAALAVACAAAPGVVAQPVDVSDTPACPAESMSVYFASGESTLSSEGRRLVSRLGDHALACKPESIDLITRINPDVDGDSAIALALARLEDVSRDLVSRGISPESIRIAARAGRDVFPPGMSEVEVIFRKIAPAAGEAATRNTAPARIARPDSI